MRFGVSKDLITPSFPMKIACSGTFDADLTEIHDDVFVRCLVMEGGGEKLVLFAFDLLFHSRDLNRSLEEYARQRYGIKPSAVIVGATHGHTTPASLGYNPGHHSEEYEKFLVSRGKTALDRAMCSMFEGSLSYDSFDVELNISRRGIVNGKFANFPAPGRPRDTELATLCVRDADGNVRSIVISYGCHPVFYPAQRSVSGEFPARLCQLLDAEFYGCTSLFFQSAGGDVRPLPTVRDGRFVSPLSFDVLDSFAKAMFRAVAERIEAGAGENINISPSSKAFAVDLPMDPLSYEGFCELSKVHDSPGAKDSPNRENIRYILNGGYAKLADSLPLHCQTVRLTDELYIATVGGEPTFGVKCCVKSAFGGKKVLFIGYTDACAYIVNDRELEEGGYEATCHLEYCLKGPFKRGIDERIKSGFLKSLEEA